MNNDQIEKIWQQQQHVADNIKDESQAELNETHQNLFDKAMDSDLPKKEIARSMDRANERFYYENNLDFGEDFVSRHALAEYDPSLAKKLMCVQIKVLEELIQGSKESS